MKMFRGSAPRWERRGRREFGFRNAGWTGQFCIARCPAGGAEVATLVGDLVRKENRYEHGSRSWEDCKQMEAVAGRLGSACGVSAGAVGASGCLQTHPMVKIFRKMEITKHG